MKVQPIPDGAFLSKLETSPVLFHPHLFGQTLFYTTKREALERVELHYTTQVQGYSKECAGKRSAVEALRRVKAEIAGLS